MRTIEKISAVLDEYVDRNIGLHLYRYGNPVQLGIGETLEEFHYSQNDQGFSINAPIIILHRETQEEAQAYVNKFVEAGYEEHLLNCRDYRNSNQITTNTFHVVTKYIYKDERYPRIHAILLQALPENHIIRSLRYSLRPTDVFIEIQENFLKILSVLLEGPVCDRCCSLS